MKLLKLFLILVVASSATSIYSQNQSSFAHPLQIEPVSIYNKIKIDALYWDKRTTSLYEQNRSITFEGEYNFWNHFSIISSIGKSDYRLTNIEPTNSYDRWNLGLKYGREFALGNSKLVVGGGLRFFDRKKGNPLNERENPDYYLVRPNFGIGFQSGRFELLTEFRFQTETNRSFKENNVEEFRRYYQFGIAPSYQIIEKLRLFTEFEYREPYDRAIDTKTRFFNFYPGLAYKTDSTGTFTLSLQQSLLSREANAIDRGIRVSYYYFFD